MAEFNIKLWHVIRKFTLTEEGFIVSTVCHCGVFEQDITDVNDVTLSDWYCTRFEVKSFSFLDRRKSFRLENIFQFGSRGANSESEIKGFCLVRRGNLNTQESGNISRKDFGLRGRLRSLPFDKRMVRCMNCRKDWREAAVKLVSILTEIVKVFW